MSLESRIRALETLLDPGSDTPVEQECQARRLFDITLSKLESRGDLPEAWRRAFHQALQALDALPPLPKHQCASKRGENLMALVRWMERHRSVEQKAPPPSLPAPTQGADSSRAIELGKETLELWARFAPHVPIPGQQKKDATGESGELDVPMP